MSVYQHFIVTIIILEINKRLQILALVNLLSFCSAQIYIGSY